MEFNKEYLCLEQNGCVFSKSIDYEENFQESLPQYCDDILKIVSCTAKSNLTSSSILNNEIKIFGKISICLTYLNESSCLCYADFEEDFNKTINTDNLSDNAFLYTNICDKYTNFRVINQRRIDIHNSYKIIIKAYDKISNPCIKSCDNSKLKLKTINSCNVINACLAKCEFDEDIKTPVDSSPIKRIIGFSAYPTLVETKTIKDKSLIKAKVNFKIMYTEDCENEKVSIIEHNFDISKIIDIPNLLETDLLLTNLYLSNIFMKSKSGFDGCIDHVQIMGEVNFNVMVVRQESLTYVTDGYILNKASNCDYCDMHISSCVKSINEPVKSEIEINLNENIKSIINVGLNICETYFKNNKIYQCVKAIIYYINNEDEVVVNETTNELCIMEIAGDNGITCSSIVSYDYVITSDKCVEIKLNSNLSAIINRDVNEKVLSEITCNDENVNYPTLSIYFGKKDESVWSIAKKFSSDVDVILKENSLTSETLTSNKILIVPGI